LVTSALNGRDKAITRTTKCNTISIKESVSRKLITKLIRAA